MIIKCDAIYGIDSSSRSSGCNLEIDVMMTSGQVEDVIYEISENEGEEFILETLFKQYNKVGLLALVNKVAEKHE